MTNEKRLILRLDKYQQAKYLSDCILFGRRGGINKYVVTFNDGAAYANACVPITGIIEYYRAQGISISVEVPKGSYIAHTRVGAPLLAECTDITSLEYRHPFGIVWKFSTSEGVYKLVSSYVEAIRRFDVVESGVLSSIEWCINEVLDNVLQHSGVETGYVMIQMNKTNKYINICIFDTGIGIYNSLKESKHHPIRPLDAITKAVQERVTRDEKIGQGNGLWGLTRLIQEAKGQVHIISSGASYRFSDERIFTKERGLFNLGAQNGAALIMFALNYKKAIDISNALNGYKPCDLWIENRENEYGDIEIMIADEAEGTGTRKSAEKLRNEIMNGISIQKSRVILDFDRVNLISSSFADELVGKIVSQYGLVFFNQFFMIRNLSKLNTTVMNRSVEQRMAQTYYDHLIADVPDDLHSTS